MTLLTPRVTRFSAISTAALGLLTASTAVPAQAPSVPVRPAVGITLPDAIQRALRENPDVLVSRATVDSAAAERRIAAAFPNPVLAGLPNSPYQYSATLALDVTPQRYYRTRTASLGAAAVSFDQHDVDRQVALAVAHSFFDALLGEEKLRLAVAHRDAIAQILRADSARFEAGDVPALSLARSEVELVRAEADLGRQRGEVRAGRLALQTAIGSAHADTEFTAIGSLEYRESRLNDDSVLATARSRRPDLLAARQRVTQSESAQRAAASLLFPTPALSYVRQTTGPFDNGHFYSFGLSFELPSLNTYRGERERSAAGASAAGVNARRADAQVERDVVAALAEYNAQRELVERYRAGLLAKVDSGVAAVQYAYSRGAASLLEVLDAVRARQDVRTEYLAALHDYWVSVYTLDAAAASDVVSVAP
jgi:cobalt-zinc-cadmium efflux system outer membrane protein